MDFSLSSPPACRGLHVLVVDDSPLQRVAATGVLRKHGLRVTCANDGQEAVDATENHDFDLVLMDVEMPRMDGIAATVAIRQREALTRKHTPVVALTSTDSRERCLAVGMNGFATKPLTAEGLEPIFAIVRQFRSRQNLRFA
jgi:two-component system sensor histidine kinase/response regulator